MDQNIPALKGAAWLVTLDGARMIAFENAGTRAEPRLVRRFAMEEHHEADHDTGADRPGRVHASTGDRRSAVDLPDLKRKAEEAFVRRALGEVDRLAQTHDIPRLVIAAPPSAMATVRAAMRPALTALMEGEDVADLTRHDIEALQARYAGR